MPHWPGFAAEFQEDAGEEEEEEEGPARVRLDQSDLWPLCLSPS